jgi:uncharacterized protein
MTRNRLATETSPYLLQHRDNPVHWYPWSDEALAAAKIADRPILLSVGYAACHWCHVMAHESFEDEATAALMNAHYINIKVDREERPDVDKVYMQALHALGEQGGWPLTMFLTPDAEPFWGGTYFPPEPRYGRPSFGQVLHEISRIWRSEKSKVAQNAATVISALKQRPQPAASALPAPATLLTQAQIVANAVDMTLGGMKGAPKFPQAPIFSFLWAAYLHSGDSRLEQAVTTTLTAMSQGGIYDHLGGGLARYSTDAQWLAPHFEKMLYDNAQFVALLSRAWLVTHDDMSARRIDETIAFLAREMMSPEGCFTSSYDADSEGEEGKYYVWTKAEITRLLGASAAEFSAAYDATPEGNWEGMTILNRSRHPELRDAGTEERLAYGRNILLAARAKRIPPAHDDKVLTDWNGIAIAALADAALAFQRLDWLQLAERAFHALTTEMLVDSELYHSRRAGRTRHLAFADDYAHLVAAALSLHALSNDTAQLTQATSLTEALERHHWDESASLFTQVRLDQTELPVIIAGIEDDVTPNANAQMAANYVRLYHATGNEAYRDRAERIVTSAYQAASSNPFAAPSLLKAAYLLIDPVQLVLVNEPQALASPLLQRTISVAGLDCIIQVLKPSGELLASHPAAGKQISNGKPTLYVCRGMTCAKPATTPAEVDEALGLLGLKQSV